MDTLDDVVCAYGLGLCFAGMLRYLSTYLYVCEIFGVCAGLLCPLAVRSYLCVMPLRAGGAGRRDGGVEQDVVRW